MSEKVFTYTERLSVKEKYLMGEGFEKVKNKLLKELKEKLSNEKDVEKKLLIIEYINNTNLLNNSIIEFSNKKSDVNGETHFINNKPEKIVIYSQNLPYQTNSGLGILLYHEFQHYIGRDKQGGNLSGKKRELNSKLLSVKNYMLINSYELNIKGINKLFSFIKDEKMKKGNHLDQSEETELFWIFEEFKDNISNLEKKFNSLVILNENNRKLIKLKNETKFT